MKKSKLSLSSSNVTDLMSIRRCTNVDSDDNPRTILKKCLINKDSELTTLGKKLGEGTFGTVYKGVYYHDGIEFDVAIKIMISEYDEDNIKQINSIISEVEYSYRMSSQGIGPKVYDSFYAIVNNDEYNDDELITYVIMELFDGSLTNAYKENLSIQNYQDMNQQVLDLLKIQIFENEMYCTDIKPDNFVYKKTKKGYEVKLIDFGEEFCKLGSFDKQNYANINIFYVILALQIMIMIYSDTYDRIDYSVFLPFFQDKRIKYYLSSPERTKELQWVLYHLLKNYDDASNMVHLYYYCYGTEIDRDKILKNKNPKKDKYVRDVIRKTFEIIDNINTFLSTRQFGKKITKRKRTKKRTKKRGSKKKY